MATDYVKIIRSKQAPDLLTMYQRLDAGQQIAGWPPGKGLEHLVLRMFELAGVEVSYPYNVNIYGTNVEQIDGAIRTERAHMLMEAKQYAEPVNVEPIAKMRSQLARRPSGMMGSVVSMKGFTEPAKILARFNQPLTILLWEGNEVEMVLKGSMSNPKSPIEALNAKLKHAMEHGVPDYNLVGN